MIRIARTMTQYSQSYNVTPSQHAAVILVQDGEPVLHKLEWNFQPHWAKNNWINARAETVFEKRAFSGAARKQRCIVPVAGWYEWDRKVTPRRPYYHTRSDGRAFGLTGIYTIGERMGIGAWLTFASLTTSPADWCAHIHHRMPFILHPRDYDTWLSPDTPISDAVAVLDNPFDDGNFEAYPVSTFVNKPQNNSAQCIERVAV